MFCSSLHKTNKNNNKSVWTLALFLCCLLQATMLHLLRKGNADDTSMLSASSDNASPHSRGKCRWHVDAVCYMPQCFTSLAREMPTSRRCWMLSATMLHLTREGNAGHNRCCMPLCNNASSPHERNADKCRCCPGGNASQLWNECYWSACWSIYFFFTCGYVSHIWSLETTRRISTNGGSFTLRGIYQMESIKNPIFLRANSNEMGCWKTPSCDLEHLSTIFNHGASGTHWMSCPPRVSIAHPMCAFN